MRRLLLLLLIALAWPRPAPADDAYVLSSDGIRLHYTVTGPPNAKTIVFIPGWTMPAWIFAPQIAYFSQTYRVIAFDPRGQGGSQIASTGYNPARRGADIADLLAQLGPRPVVIVGWSLGVLDTLAYIHQDGDARIAGLVLIDNSVGENPPPAPRRYVPEPARNHAAYMRAFVAGMFRTRQSPAYLARLTAATLVTPACDAAALLRYPVPRSYWREAIFSTTTPVLYVVRPGLRGQADNLRRDRPDTQIAIFTHAGHALFVDDAKQFNALMANFLVHQVWP
jgi:microsomal epoxide hydrolase